MEHEKVRVSVELTLKKHDADRLGAFLSATGRKRGPFVKQFILRTLDDWDRTKKGAEARS